MLDDIVDGDQIMVMNHGIYVGKQMDGPRRTTPLGLPWISQLRGLCKKKLNRKKSQEKVKAKVFLR